VFPEGSAGPLLGVALGVGVAVGGGSFEGVAELGTDEAADAVACAGELAESGSEGRVATTVGIGPASMFGEPRQTVK
jgi:hypothetical protein